MSLTASHTRVLNDNHLTLKFDRVLTILVKPYK